MVNKRGHKQSLVHGLRTRYEGIWNEPVSQVEDRWLTHGFPGVRISRISVLPIPSSISGPLEPRVQDFPIDLGAGRRMGIWFRKAVGCSHLVHVLSRYLTPTPFIIPTQPRASSSNLYMEPPKPDIIPPPGLRGGLGVYSSGIGLLGLGRE